MTGAAQTAHPPETASSPVPGRTRASKMARLFPSGLLFARGGRKGRTSRAVALTFDDGPHPVNTPRVLDALAVHGAKAAFFLVGKEVRAYPEIVRRIAAEGHTLGCHTDSHVDLSKLGFRAALRECRDCADAIEAACGSRPRYLRPPWGRIRPSTLLVSLRLRMPIALWSLDSLDYAGSGSEATVDRIRRANLEPGEIVLFHDDYAATADAIAPVLETLCSSSLECRNLEDLLGR